MTPSPSAAPQVTVAVVTYNSARVIVGLIESLPAGLEGCDWKLVVADNNSCDDTVGLIRAAAPNAQIVEMGHNAGYAAGINAATRAGGTETDTLILNADTRLTPGSALPMFRALAQPGIGIVVPRLIDTDGTLGYSLRREPTIRRSLADAIFGQRLFGRIDSLSEGITNPAAYARPVRADWVAGPVLVVSRACRQACGDWDESFFLYSEETDYCLRARDLGFASLLTPDSEVVHLGGESSMSPELWTLVVVNRVRLYARRHGPAETVGFWLVAVLREGTRGLLGRRTSQQAFAALLTRRRFRDAPARAAGSVPSR